MEGQTIGVGGSPISPAQSNHNDQNVKRTDK